MANGDDDIIILSSDEEEAVVASPPSKRAKRSYDDEDGHAKKTVNGSSEPKVEEESDDDVQCIDIDDELLGPLPLSTAPSQKPDPEASSSTSAKTVVRNLEDLVYKIRNYLKPKERTKVKDKLFKKLEHIDLTSDGTARELADYVVEITQQITSDQKQKWSKLCLLFSFMDSKKSSSKKKSNLGSHDGETPEEREERKKKAKIIKIEKKLAEIEKEIEKWGRREVDLDDDRNSSYLVKSRMEKKYMSIYELLCRETQCNTYTGRPIEKKIKLPKDVTRYPEINAAVEKFINGKDILFIPDFHDIEKIVNDVNQSSPLELLPSSEVNGVARTLFNKLMMILRSRRQQDFEIAVPLSKTEDDPAENDEELKKKLEENAKLQKSEQDIIETFVKKQLELQDAAKEVPAEENPDDSAQESDDESEDFDAENDDANDAPKTSVVYTREQAADTDSEEEVEEEEKKENGDAEVKTNNNNNNTTTATNEIPDTLAVSDTNKA